MKKSKFYIFLNFIIIIILSTCVLFVTAMINNGCDNKAVIDEKTKFENTSAEGDTIKDTETVEDEQLMVEKAIGNSEEEGVERQNENLEEKNEIIFSFTVFGDNGPEDGDSPQPEQFLKILELVKGCNPDFVFSTGDIIHGKPDDNEIIKRQFLDFLDAISILDCKIYIAPGDHDVSKEVTRSYFNKLINKDSKSYFYFEYKDVYFIVLDANEEKRGEISGEQLKWLKDLLSELREKKVFVFLHQPVYSILNPECITDGSLHLAFSDKKNQNNVRNLFNEFKVDGVFSGHEHLFNINKYSNTTYIISGCCGSDPRGTKEEDGFSGYILIDIKNESWIYMVIDLSGKTVTEKIISFN